MQQYINEINNIWKLTEECKIKKLTEENLNLIKKIISDLEIGKNKICEKASSKTWNINEWIKKAILLYIKFNECQIINCGEVKFFDKIPLKFKEKSDFSTVRLVPGGYVRQGVYLGKNVVIMPSFINIGAYIDDYTMIDSGTTIGSCAHVGKNCHISSNVCLGGVLEPIQEHPVIIEDNCFIGAGSCISEGVIVEEGTVISTGNFISKSSKIFNKETGEIIRGKIPAYSVVVPGVLPNGNNLPGLQCSIIIKKVDKNTLKKTAINNILREIE